MRSFQMNLVFLFLVVLFVKSNTAGKTTEEVTPIVWIEDDGVDMEKTTAFPMPVQALTDDFSGVFESFTGGEVATRFDVTATDMVVGGTTDMPVEEGTEITILVGTEKTEIVMTEMTEVVMTERPVATPGTTDSPTTPFPFNVNIDSSLSYFHPQFTRPFGGEGETFYELYSLIVSYTGDYRIGCQSSFYTYLLLYSPTFDPESSSSNLIENSDAFGASEVRHRLQLSEQYYVVVTGYFSETTGSFSLTVSGPELPVLTKLTDTTLSTRGINGILRRYRRFQRPGGVYPSYFYSVYQVIVRRSGHYIFSSNSSANLMGFLYVNNFFAGQPEANLAQSGPNSEENGQFRFRTYLSSPRTYYFVVTTPEPRVTTHFRLSVSGVVNVLLEPIKSMILTTATVSSEWTLESEDFRRPLGFGQNHYYKVFQVTVDEKGLYTLSCASTVDSVGYIYINSFDPSSPTENLLTYDDQHAANEIFGGNDQFGLTLVLETDVTYYLVATTFREFRFGTFDILVQGEGHTTISEVNKKRRRRRR